MATAHKNSRASNRWIIVANESVAEIFAWEFVGDSIKKLFELTNDSARRKQQDLVSDDAGRAFDSKGRGRHALSNKVSQKEAAVVHFAADIVERIVQARQQGHCRDFAVIAAPRFLGHLRSALKKTSLEDPYTTISKDIVGAAAQEIAARLSKS